MKYRITLPYWMNDEVDNMTDKQIAEFIRMEANLCLMREERDKQEEIRQAQRRETWSRLSWGQRWKVRLGLLRI